MESRERIERRRKKNCCGYYCNCRCYCERRRRRKRREADWEMRTTGLVAECHYRCQCHKRRTAEREKERKK